VFPVNWAVAFYSLIVCAIVGMAIGSLTGWLASLITRRGTKGVLKDAFLGSLGCVVGIFATYRHQERVAIALAILLPLVHEIYRLKRPSTSSTPQLGE
jgi:uncharacterized membrane protein YeaQ/YmgE (transglycosylase-associated protein family)